MWYIIYSISPICVLFVHKIRCPSFDTIQYFDVGCNVQVSASDNMPASVTGGRIKLWNILSS